MNKKVLATLVTFLLSVVSILILIFLKKWSFITPIFITMMLDYILMTILIQKCHNERIKEKGLKKNKYQNNLRRSNYLHQGIAISLSFISSLVVILSNQPPIKIVAVVIIIVSLIFLFKSAFIKYDVSKGDLK